MALPHTYADIRARVADRGFWSMVHARLAARSRVTNLGVLLLAFALTLSLLFNLHGGAPPRVLRMPPQQCPVTEHAYDVNMRLALPALPPHDAALSHLVLVAGHAIWSTSTPPTAVPLTRPEGGDASQSMRDESWFLEPYQLGGSVQTFIKHIQKGVQLAAQDNSSLLVFSGGQTRDNAWITEAESYYHLALGLGLELPYFRSANSRETSKEAFGPLDGSGAGAAGAAASADSSKPALRMTTENFALDSFQNLLFGIARFREFTGEYPQKITVVGYGVKKPRFESLHARALRWPVTSTMRDGSRRFNYIGIDDPGNITGEQLGEKSKAYQLFEFDMYGCHGRLLEKRRSRNMNRRIPPYSSSAREIAPLLDWCPTDRSALQGLFRGWLPWDPRVQGSGIGRGAQAQFDANGGRFIQNDVLPDGKRIVY